MTDSDSIRGVYDILQDVFDPEIPVLSVLDLGIVRRVRTSDGIPEVTITPTYSGCPAMHVMEENIRNALLAAGYKDACVIRVLTPPWTTDWMSEAGREKLRAYGITPPSGKSTDSTFLLNEFKRVPCPRCASDKTEMISQFGSTACKALFRCTDCREPFDYFKCH